MIKCRKLHETDKWKNIYGWGIMNMVYVFLNYFTLLGELIVYKVYLGETGLPVAASATIVKLYQIYIYFNSR